MITTEIKQVTVVRKFCDICGREITYGYSMTVGKEFHVCNKFWPQKQTDCQEILFNQLRIGTRKFSKPQS